LESGKENKRRQEPFQFIVIGSCFMGRSEVSRHW